MLLFGQFSFASSLTFLQCWVFLITASIMFKIGYTCSIFSDGSSIKDYLDGTLYWEVHLICYRFHTSYIWFLLVGDFIVFKHMLVLLSGHLNSNTTVPACFGSVFKFCFSTEWTTIFSWIPLYSSHTLVYKWSLHDLLLLWWLLTTVLTSWFLHQSHQQWDGLTICFLIYFKEAVNWTRTWQNFCLWFVFT